MSGHTHNTGGLREIHRNIASVVIISADSKILMGRELFKAAGYIPSGK
jgi:hypothetical protein